MNGKKILLQHRQTKLFFMRGGGWARLPEDACSFPTPLTAVRFSSRENLVDTEVVFVPNGPVKSEWQTGGMNNALREVSEGNDAH
jgi:hypothetical protein